MKIVDITYDRLMLAGAVLLPSTILSGISAVAAPTCLNANVQKYGGLGDTLTCEIYWSPLQPCTIIVGTWFWPG